MPRILLATNNAGKIAEFQRLLAGCGWELMSPADLALEIDVDEDGDTYEANALKKAAAGAQVSGLITLADDSGLEVQAMGGEPGVRSARFLRPDASFAERFSEIHHRLAEVPRDKWLARFVCVIAIADPATSAIRTVEDEVRGMIAVEPAGSGGFGYDPIFWLPQHSCTMAELPEREKDIISHRGRAAARARQILRELLHDHRQENPS